MGLGTQAKTLTKAQVDAALNHPLPPSKPRDPAAFRKGRAQGEGDRLPDLGHGDDLGRRGRDRYPPDQRGE